MQESMTVFEDFVVQGQGLVIGGQGLGLVNWSSKIHEDKELRLEDKD